MILPDPRISVPNKILGAVAIGPLSLPALVVLDRGNTVGFVVPAVLMIAVGLQQRRYLTITIGAVLATLVKPQFVVLVLLLFALRRSMYAIYAVLAAGLSQIAAYLPFGERAPENVAQTLSNILGYGTHVPLSDGYPTNVSLANSLHFVAQRTVGWGESVSIGITFALCLFTVVVLIFVGPSFPAPYVTVAFIVMSALAVPISWPYYLVIVPATVLLASFRDRRPDRLLIGERRGILGASTGVAVVLGIANIISASAFILPVSTGGQRTLLVSQEFAGGGWIAFLLVCGLCAMRSFIIGTRNLTRFNT